MNTSPRSATFTAEFPATPDQVREVRHAVVAYGRDHGVADLDAIAIAVTEAVSNAVMHAYVGMPVPGTVQVTATTCRNGGLEVVVADDGRGPVPRDDSPGIGLGVPLMHALSDAVELRGRAGGGTRVRMLFAVADRHLTAA
jgi:anti-sigma regulatory factor (Ser/Thr protein kinase)